MHAQFNKTTQEHLVRQFSIDFQRPSVLGRSSSHRAIDATTLCAPNRGFGAYLCDIIYTLAESSSSSSSSSSSC